MASDGHAKIQMSDFKPVDSHSPQASPGTSLGDRQRSEGNLASLDGSRSSPIQASIVVKGRRLSAAPARPSSPANLRPDLHIRVPDARPRATTATNDRVSSIIAASKQMSDLQGFGISAPRSTSHDVILAGRRKSSMLSTSTEMHHVGTPGSGSRISDASDRPYSERSCCWLTCGVLLRFAGWCSGLRSRDIQAAEADKWWAMMWPLAVTAAARLSLLVIDQGFLGYLGTTELAGASLAGIWIDVTSGWLWPSFGSSVTALASQAIGAKNDRLAGIWLQTAMVLVSGCVVLVGLALGFSEHLYLATGFRAEESSFAGLFSKWYILALAPAFWYIVVAAFLKAQSMVMVPMLVNIVMVALNVFFNLLFIHGTDWLVYPAPGWNGLGFIGSPIATSLARWICFLLLLGGIFWARCDRSHSLTSTWQGWNLREALSGPRLFQMGCLFILPLALSNLLEELQLQVVAFFAAELGTVDLAAHTCMLSLFFFCSSAMYSAVDATSSRIGHHLGAGDIVRAKFVMWVDTVFSGIMSIVIGAIIMLAGGNLARLFSKDPAVVAAVAPLSLLVEECYILISLFFVSMAVLTAMGKTTSIAIAFVTNS
jgi:multidrug resistance protein, MATE family